VEATGWPWRHEQGLILLEVYRGAADGRPESDAALELTSGDAMQLVGAMHVPDDEVVFYLVRASSGDAVRRAAETAGLRVLRVTAASWTAAAEATG
jgi:hypothetical protein